MDNYRMFVKYCVDSGRVKAAIVSDRPLTCTAHILQALGSLPRELRPYTNGLGDSTVDLFAWFMCDSQSDLETTYHSVKQTPYQNGRIAVLPRYQGYVVYETY